MKLEILGGIRDSLSNLHGSIVYNLEKVNNIAVKYGQTFNDINELAMWSLQHPKNLFPLDASPYDNSAEPAWYSSMEAGLKSDASQFLLEHIGKAGTAHYGLLSGKHAKAFSETYGVSVDDVIQCARFLFRKSVTGSLTGPLAQRIFAPTTNTTDLSLVLKHDKYVKEHADALFEVIKAASSATISLSYAFEDAYGPNTAKWNLQHPNVLAAEKTFQEYYMYTVYNPRDRFEKASMLLGGTLEYELREKIVKLMHTPIHELSDPVKKQYRKDMLRTASQEFARCLDRAKTLCDERNKDRSKVIDLTALNLLSFRNL